MELIFLDTETTGADVKTDRLSQVCYRTSAGLKMEYFKPPLPISVKAMSVTHITNKMVADKPAFIGSQMHKDLEELFKDGVLVAHNAKFDKAILENEGLVIPKFICTLRVARFIDTKNIIPEYNLQYLRYYLDIEVEGNAHDAEGDVNVLYAVYQRLFAKVRKDVATDEEAIAKMIEISSQPSVYRKFNFGKHIDKSLEDVVKVDRGYLEWLLKTKQSADDYDEDWIHTLKHYLGQK